MYNDGNFNVMFDLDGGGSEGTGAVLDNATASQEAIPQPNEVIQQRESTSQNVPETAKGNPWMEQLPKDLRDNEALKGFKTIGDLANAYLGKNTEDVKGGKSDGFLKFDDKSSEWADFKDTVNGDITGIITSGLVDVAKKNGMTTAQLKEVMKGINENSQKSIEKMHEQAPAVCEKVLKEMWADKYDANVEDMQKGWTKIIGDDKEFYLSLKNAGLDNSPLVCELLRRTGTFFNTPKPYTGRVEHVNGNDNRYNIPSEFYQHN